MSELLKNIDARTKLAGTNNLEILLFSLGNDPRSGRREIFGINVFKVREVMKTPAITVAPDMPEAVEGMVSLRGALVPIVDLAKYIGIQSEEPRAIMIVTEYNQHVQGFLVESVDTILRLDWSKMRVPPEMLNSKMGGRVTAVTELPSGEIVMMLDVEKVLAETAFTEDHAVFEEILPVKTEKELKVIFADDSSVARSQISRTLDALKLRYQGYHNGRAAVEGLLSEARIAEATGRKAADTIGLILTDVEMPEMDGYMLTKTVKTDKRFAGIPVIMHSSLSGISNAQLGQSVGVDEYVSKFEPKKLADALRRIITARGGEVHE